MNNKTTPFPKLRVKGIHYDKKKRLSDTDHAEWYHIGHYEAISDKTGDEYELHVVSSIGKDAWGPTGQELTLNKLTKEGYERISLWDLPGYGEHRGNPGSTDVLRMLANSIGHELEEDPIWYPENYKELEARSYQLVKVKPNKGDIDFVNKRKPKKIVGAFRLDPDDYGIYAIHGIFEIMNANYTTSTYNRTFIFRAAGGLETNIDSDGHGSYNDEAVYALKRILLSKGIVSTVN